MANLSSTEINKWKKSMDSLISTKLVNALNDTKKYTDQLVTCTKSQDENDLNYRYSDLSKLAAKSVNQLKTFMSSFDSDLEKYLSTVKEAEKAAANKAKKAIDQFAEASSKINNLKM